METRPARPEEIDLALTLVATSTGVSPGEAVIALHEAARRGEVNFKDLIVAVDAERVVGAALAITTPGRTAFITLPGAVKRRLEHDVMVGLLMYWRRESAPRNLALLQVFTTPDDRRRRRYIEEAGFDFLADLIYLERPTDVRTGEAPIPPELTWTTYSAETHALFAEVIRASYRQSLDCPSLEGRRAMDDVIAGHKAQGQFDPQRWFVLTAEDKPAGCLLLNALPERGSLDLTYMGLAPDARGRGLGVVLVQRAIDETRRAGHEKLTCAVDANNLPAIKTYARFNFRSTDTKRVFIGLPQAPTDSRPDAPR